MFLILLHYKKPLEDIDRLIPEHRRFLERYYASGHFMVSGRQEPRNGGVIVARAGSRGEVEKITRDDPFFDAGVADYEIIEFIPSMSAPQLNGLVL